MPTTLTAVQRFWIAVCRAIGHSRRREKLMACTICKRCGIVLEVQR